MMKSILMAPKWAREWGAAAVINRHFLDGETTFRHLSKRLPDNSTIFAAEATAITLALNYYQYMGPIHHDVVVYSDWKSCLQAIEGKGTEKPFICHIMNLFWLLSDKASRVRFCWIPSHCGIEGNERVDQIAKETLDHNIDPLETVHHADLKPFVNSYIQQLVQTKWDVAVHDNDLYLLKPTLGRSKKFQHLTRAEKIVITRLRIGHTKATKAHILSRGPPTTGHHCGQTLTIDYMLFMGKSWRLLHSWLIEYSLWDFSSLDLHCGIPASRILLPDMNGQTFYTIPHLNNPLTEAFCYNSMYTTSDMNGHISSTTLDFNELATDKILNLTPPDLYVEDKQIWENLTCEGLLIYPEGCVSLNKCNPTNLTNSTPMEFICSFREKKNLPAKLGHIESQAIVFCFLVRLADSPGRPKSPSMDRLCISSRSYQPSLLCQRPFRMTEIYFNWFAGFPFH